LLTTINFDRASKDALRNIARRVLKSENIDYDTPAVEALISSNPGDLRALVRDLQVICASSKNSIDKNAVVEYVESSERDVSVEVFPGLAKLYKSRTSQDAIKLGISIDKSPSELLNWIHWNNPSIFTDKIAIDRGNKALCQSSKMLMAMYENTAHRSWYWSSQISGLAASVVNQKDMPEKLFPSYPNFLRRGASQGRNSIINRLTEITGASKSSVREELLPLLISLHSETSEVGNVDDFAISIDLGLTGDEHAALCGLPKTRKSTKELVARYNLIETEQKQTIEATAIKEIDDSEIIKNETKSNKGQRTLF